MLIPPPPKPANVIEILGPNRFRCACCLRVNFKAWSDEESQAELHKNFGPDFEGDTELLCDNCYDVVLLMQRVAAQDNRRRFV
jgi:hypothetical protein